MFTCLNQACEAQWQPEEVEIRNEGQGELFRCPLCRARNFVMRSEKSDGRVVYKQVLPEPKYL
ncbi:hypothetical protein [Jeongeupia sp. USM3]|uniref:hypothetical protein n=1 Tax=Jeongeupia sp. USM3 TaxID=1906741 RepID=UPI00089DE024|nr:hypothetical protein [Jeongeupia sp. USM3]AOY01938.1 hypothetical protein BJP62_16705 [Jeongeupia sp. USM3]